MGRQARFGAETFIAAAKAIAAAEGPAAVTVATVTARAKAPTGSFYHRFASRDALLAELWLSAQQSFQRGFVALADLDDGPRAAVYTLDWARGDMELASLVLLYSRTEIIGAQPPAKVKEAERALQRQLEACLSGFVRRNLHATTAEAVRRARFALLELPAAAARTHLERREAIPASVDHMVRAAYPALIAPPVKTPARRPR
jgi:AcrR family transcriptional regulator